MRESKAEVTDRLRREGRWDAFKKRREEVKAGGMAASDAWDVAAAEFAPSDGKPPGEAAPKVDLQALKGKPPVSIVQAAAWAFEQLDCDWTTPADAPSPGAWGMLEWARSSMAARTEFYRTFAAKIVLLPQEEARRADEERQRKRSTANATTRDAIDRLLRERHKSDDSLGRERPPAS